MIKGLAHRTRYETSQRPVTVGTIIVDDGDDGIAVLHQPPPTAPPLAIQVLCSSVVGQVRGTLCCDSLVITDYCNS